LVIGISGFFSKACKEASRKFIHIMLANWWIIAMIFFDNIWIAGILPALFIIINYASYKFDIIKSMERDDDSGEEKTLGTVFYAISLLIVVMLCFGFFKNTIIGLVGILVMGYGDGFAAIAGKSIKSKEFSILGGKKSLAGCSTMFIISLIIISCALAYFNVQFWYIKSIIIALVATIFEAISVKGTDNLTVPILTTLMVWMVL
jgi:phytol kinase